MPKEKGVSYLGDSDRTTSYYTNLLSNCLWLLGKYKLCDNILVSLSGNTESILLIDDTFL
jgi:hypothetical protein